jgi:hypothetical protein
MEEDLDLLRLVRFSFLFFSAVAKGKEKEMAESVLGGGDVAPARRFF